MSARLVEVESFREKEDAMHVSNKVSPKLLSHLFRMIADGAIIEDDLQEFCNDPQIWRKPVPADSSSHAVVTLEDAQAFWQGVYDELAMEIGGRLIVPPVPRLTDKQVKSLDKFGFMLVYVAIVEDRYPASFVKPGWDKHLNAAAITRMPLKGKWVAVETIAKPHYDDPAGYPDDRLMAAIKRASRFNTSWDDLTNGLLTEIAKATGFPKKGTRLPTAEEWNLIANLFNWLREHRGISLPDLGSTRSWEWCENTYDADGRLIVGFSARGGLAGVRSDWHDFRHDILAFRVLADL